MKLGKLRKLYYNLDGITSLVYDIAIYFKSHEQLAFVVLHTYTGLNRNGLYGQETQPRN